MSTVKRLYEILPADKRIVESLQMQDIKGKTLTLHGATLQTAGGVVYAKMTVSVDPSVNQFYVTANQEQITSIVKFVMDANAFPVSVKIVSMGKSYAMVDPLEYGAKIEQPVLPGSTSPAEGGTK